MSRQIGKVPVSIGDNYPDLYMFLQDLRDAIVEIRPSALPPSPPSSVHITPVAGGCHLDWVRSSADGYIVYTADTPSFDANVTRAIDTGNSSGYTDYIGKGGVKRYYWIRSYRSAGRVLSNPTVMVSGTTLNLGTAADIPAPPPPTFTPSQSATTGLPTHSQVRGGTRKDI